MRDYEKYELFKWYKGTSGMRDKYFFIYKQRPPWEYNVIKYDDIENSWSNENVGFIYAETWKDHKISIVPVKDLERLIKNIFMWHFK